MGLAGNRRGAPAATGSATAKGSASAATTTPTKKKPYRRSKIPSKYISKSTVTTCTPTAASESSNVYDAVLGEAEDLLRAATDAQNLGRLKMASNYLLLLHARLVGLGKKFDRAKTAPSSLSEESSMRPTKLDMSPERTNKRKGATLAVTDMLDPEQEPKTPTKPSYEERPAIPPSNIISEAALNQLTNYLPSNIELDQAMVEHLARAAAELHQKRTGKKTAEEGLLNSPAMNTEVFHYNKDVPDKERYASPKKQHKKEKLPYPNRSVAWTDEEQRKFQEIVDQVGRDDPELIAKMMGTRNAVQVEAYLELEKTNESLTEQMNYEDREDTPRKRGGRGRKPPTTAMNTVPNASLDAKAMLEGSFVGLT